MKVSSTEFIDSLQHLYVITYNQPIQIEKTTFLRDIQRDTQKAAELFYELAKKYQIPVSINHIEGFFKQGPSFVVKDLYHEFIRAAAEHKAQRSRMAWLLIAYSMVPVSIYALFTVDIILAFSSATLGTAILTYHYGIKPSRQ